MAVHIGTLGFTGKSSTCLERTRLCLHIHIGIAAPFFMYTGSVQFTKADSNPSPDEWQKCVPGCAMSLGLEPAVIAFAASLPWYHPVLSKSTDHEARGYISNTINTAFSCRSITSDTFSNRNGDLLYFRGSDLAPPPLLLSVMDPTRD